VRRFSLVSALAVWLSWTAPAIARAPVLYRLTVNDRAVLSGAHVNCFAWTRTALMCGGGNSRLFVQIKPTTITVLREKADTTFVQIFQQRR
jgi:hypothetical protein